MVTDNREEFITDNIALVHSVARRFRNRGADYEDIFQAGCLGLIKAVDGFDETKGFKFSTYAIPVIMGEIKRIFRDGGQIKISRSLKEKSNHVQYHRERFINEHRREPTISELSELTGIEVNELCEVINILNPVLSLSFDNNEEEFDIPFNDADKQFNRILVHIALKSLNSREQKMVYLRFFSGKTQAETAKILGISQVQVSRKEKDILNKLRNILKE